jgi:hypothetical protein
MVDMFCHRLLYLEKLVWSTHKYHVATKIGDNKDGSNDRKNAGAV